MWKMMLVSDLALPASYLTLVEAFQMYRSLGANILPTSDIIQITSNIKMANSNAVGQSKKKKLMQC